MLSKEMKALLLTTTLLTLVACGGDDSAQHQSQAQEAANQSAASEMESPAAEAEVADMTQADPASETDASVDNSNPSVDKSNPAWKTSLEAPALMTFEPGQEIFWTLETNLGDMRFKLFPDVAPMHVTSTIYLTELGFYDEVIFHRVITSFMAQGGDPMGTGQGGPGYEYDGEFSDEVRHDRPGLLSMANRGPGTDGSQFFITFVPTPWLDGKHTIFGEIVSGQETLAEMEKRGSRSGATSEKLVIKRASIER